MRRGRLLILLGLILACGTAAVVFLLLQNVSKAPATVEVKTEKVVVVAQPIKEGEVVDGRLELADRAVPVAEDALRTLDGTTGMLAKGDLGQNTIVTAGMLQTKEEQMRKGQVGQLVEPGYVAMAFPITELSSVSYGIQPDDLVDVLVTFVFVDLDTDTQSKEPLCPPICPATEGGQTTAAGAVQNPRLVAQLTLQKIRVLGVGRWTYLPPTPAPNQQTGGDTAVTAGEPPAVYHPDVDTARCPGLETGPRTRCQHRPGHTGKRRYPGLYHSTGHVGVHSDPVWRHSASQARVHHRGIGPLVGICRHVCERKDHPSNSRRHL